MVEALGLQVGEDTAGAAYRAWSEERDRHARLAKLCLDAGVEKRLVRVTEQQAALGAGDSDDEDEEADVA